MKFGTIPNFVYGDSALYEGVWRFLILSAPVYNVEILWGGGKNTAQNIIRNAKNGGSMIKVWPIKDRRLLGDIQADLSRQSGAHGRRVYLMFCVGIYTGLRIGDIVGLQVKHVSGQYINLVEQKTQKETEVAINENLAAILDERLAGMDWDDWLFPSQKRGPGGQIRHISTRTAEDDMHWIARRYGLDFPFCCHSMRKTFGYWYYKDSGGDIEGLRQYFNHSDTFITKRYICVDREEVNERSRKLYMGYRPPKEGRRQSRERASAPMTVKRGDRTVQGKKWAEKMQQKREREKKSDV